MDRWQGTSGWNAWPWQGARWSTSGWVRPTDISAAQADALKLFYDTLAGDQWTNGAQGSGSDAWGDTATANDWYGVTVAGGVVTALSLANNSLVGDAGSTLTPLAASLATLDIGQNTGLTDIDVSGLTALANIDFAGCGWGYAVVTGVLADIVTAGVAAGTLDIGGSNSAPQPGGVTSLQTLEDDGWTLTYSTVLKITTGSFYLITADGDATIRSTATDLSGQTDKYIVAYDGTNDKYAEAYGYAQDAAESLGSELVSDGDMEAAGLGAWPVIQGVGTKDANSHGGALALKHVTAGTNLTVQQNVGFSNGNLYLLEGWYQSTGNVRVYCGNSLNDSVSLTAAGVYTQFSAYLVNTGSAVINLFNIDAGTTYWDDITAKQVTALGTDALQLRNAATGSTRNWTDIEASFAPNLVSKVEVFNV